MKTNRLFFKLGADASVFSDHISGLKITKNIPGSTIKPESKATKVAEGNGHIIRIDEATFLDMMEAVTKEERIEAYKEQNYDPNENQRDDQDESEDSDTGNTGTSTSSSGKKKKK